jgi:P27 family predicted phage terminase small subunit
MKRGRKNKPAELRVIEGNRGHRPIPQGPKFKIPVYVPKPPPFLDKYAKKEWARVAPELYSLGLLLGPDVAALAAYCMAFSRWRYAEEELQKVAQVDDSVKHGGLVQITKQGNAVQHVLVGVANTARKDMIRIAAEFGLTPSSRASLQGAGSGSTKRNTAEEKFFGS